MAIRKVFKSHLPSVNFFFKDGFQGAFLLGRYETDVPSRIKELKDEVDNGHPHIYIDPSDQEVDSEAPTPLELIRQQAYEQAKADLIASGLMSDKVSTSDSGSFKDSITNTANIAEAAMGSDTNSAVSASAANVPVPGGAQLMNPALSAALANLKK